jgi:ATP-dependent RNA helicase SUPV3L1/SUV3
MPRRDEAHAFKAREAGVATPEPIGTQNMPRPERKYAGRPRPAEDRGNAHPASQPPRQPQRAGPRKDKGREPQPEAQRHGGETHHHGVWASTEKSRERQPDPNSPFAKLLVLKQQMESRGKN